MKSKKMPEGKPWGFASYECKKLDAHLPVIRSAIENKKITKIIQGSLKNIAYHWVRTKDHWKEILKMCKRLLT